MDANVKTAPVANNLEIQCILFSKQFHQSPSFFAGDFVLYWRHPGLEAEKATVSPGWMIVTASAGETILLSIATRPVPGAIRV